MAITSAWAGISQVRGDEGMYLFNDLPLEALSQRHQFIPDEYWANELRLASVRFNVGGSGSFVSSNGLVLTNHHVASDTLAKLSDPQRNIIANGFLAKSYDEELKAPDLELNQLLEIMDVTDQVNAAIANPEDTEEAFKQRRAAIANIEKESLDETGLRSDVVTLFGGAKYHLYRYKKYTDVRLVWAPETATAFFGGDADNFEYPRYCLDATLMRVYEDGKPAKLQHYLRWSKSPVQEDDLVFVSGHPARTQRIFTVEALEFLRDKRMPYTLDYLRRKEVLIQQYQLESKEAARRGRDDMFGIQNSRKAYSGMLAGLQDPATIEVKRVAQDRLLSEIKKSDLAPLAAAWEEVAAVQIERSVLIGQSVSLRSELFSIGLQILLLAVEDQKPNEERLREYSDAGRESLLTQLLSPAPIYDDLERVKLADEIAWMLEHRGMDDPLVRKVLAGRSPRSAAAELIAGTGLIDPDHRRKLVDGGLDAVMESTDPILALARTLEPEYRRVREIEESLEEREKQAYAKITEATLAVNGTSGYPDATFTLRLAFGLVKGYQQDGKFIQPATTIGGAFEHAVEHAGQADFDLPESWNVSKEKLDLTKQFNFVSTADIIGGNSGSPVVNRKGELVGLIFDGNIQSLTSDYLYTDEQSRSVSVAGEAIKHCLRVIYDSPSLADELGN